MISTPVLSPGNFTISDALAKFANPSPAVTIKTKEKGLNLQGLDGDIFNIRPTNMTFEEVVAHWGFDLEEHT